MSGMELIQTASQRGLIQQAVLLSGLESTQLSALECAAREKGLPLLGCLNKPLNTLELRRLLTLSVQDD